jgi:hypothetical protein
MFSATTENESSTPHFGGQGEDEYNGWPFIKPLQRLSGIKIKAYKSAQVRATG